MKQLETECINSIVDMRIMVEDSNMKDSKGIKSLIDHYSANLYAAITSNDELVLDYVAKQIEELNYRIRRIVGKL